MILEFFNTIFIYHDCEEISNMTLPCVFQVTINFAFCFMNYNTISRFFNPIKSILLPTITHHQFSRKNSLSKEKSRRISKSDMESTSINQPHRKKNAKRRREEHTERRGHICPRHTFRRIAVGKKEGRPLGAISMRREGVVRGLLLIGR